jgi:hypothetical protein
MPNNISELSFVSTSALPGTVSAIASGAAKGISRAGKASTRTLEETKLDDRNSLLNALAILCEAGEEFGKDPFPGQDLFANELKNILGFFHKSAASTANNLITAPIVLGSHLSQLPLDVTAALQAIYNSIPESRPFMKTKEASTLNRAQEEREHKIGFSANCRALCDNLEKIRGKLNEGIDERIPAIMSVAQTHARFAKSTAFTATAGSLATPALVSLMVDAIGSSFREISALAIFSNEESRSQEENNVYQAFSACCRSFSSNKNSQESLQALLDLEKALLDFGPAKEMLNNHSVHSPVTSVFLRMITAEPFVKTLIGVNVSSLALTKAHEALNQENDKLSELTRQSAARASLIKDFSGGDAQNHSQNVIDFCKLFDEAIDHIDKELQPGPNHSAMSSTAKSAVRSESALLIASSLVTGFFGLMTREFSGSIDFTKQDKGSRAECQEVWKTDQAMTGENLDKLLSRVCGLKERLERCEELGVSAPVALGISQAITSGSLIASLNMVAGMYSALRELRTLAESPSIPLKLNADEEKRVEGYVESAEKSNKKTANTLGTGGVSDNLTLQKHLDSVMRKVVLIHRSYNNFAQPDMDRPDLDSFAKASIAFSQGNSTGFLLGSLGVLTLASLQSGIGTEALLGATRFSLEARRLSDGVDRCELPNGSKSNISFFSNATRLIEQSMGSSSILQTGTKGTNLIAESVFSRTLLVALCHSGALKEMMRQLIEEEEKKLHPAPGALDSALISDALIPRWEDNILRVLNEAEANRNPIPGLNADMASGLALATNASIAAALSSHSTLITPFLESIVAARRASQIDEAQKNEAITADSEISRVLSTSLNIIQAFTRNFRVEIKAIADPFNHSTLVQSSHSSYAESMVIACGVSLLCEELFEIGLSRTLTLLDKKKLDQTAGQSSNNSKEESGLCRDAVAEDSGSGQKNSVSHIISALRLTLSHLGVALGNFASELNVNPDILKDDLHMHTSQRAMIDALVSGFSHCSAAMLSASGVLSNLPMSSVGSIEFLRDSLHSFDRLLKFRQTNSSEDYTQSCGSSDSTLLTGMATDCLFNILSIITKLLLKASVLGMDTTLSIAKIMEILSLHPRPDEAMSLELQGASQPNGFLANLNEQLRRVCVLGSLGTASFTMATKTNDSAKDCLQAAVDHQIEQVALLEDEEEDEGSTLGLKGFYKILMRTLRDIPNAEEDYNDLVERLHRGGIALTNYHSTYKGLEGSNDNARKNHLISNDGFYDCDDAAELLMTFINEAYDGEPSSSERLLLDDMKQALLAHGKLSEKVQTRWAYIVDSVIDRLKEDNMRNRMFHPGESRGNAEKWTKRQSDLLTNWEPPVAQVGETSAPYEPIM